jgi:hypothetical protein
MIWRKREFAEVVFFKLDFWTRFRDKPEITKNTSTPTNPPGRRFGQR